MPRDPTGSASTIARTPRDGERKRAPKKGGISGAPKGKSLPLSLAISRPALVLALALGLPFYRSVSTPYHPFGEQTLSFLSCALMYTRACTRTHAPGLSLPFSYTRSHSLAPAPLSVPGDPLPSRDPASLPARTPRAEGEPTERENRFSTMSYPNPNPTRPRRVCIHAPLAPTFRDPGHGSLPPLVLRSHRQSYAGILTPRALLSRKTL